MRPRTLTRIESRPARDRPWSYLFFLDLQNNEHVPAAIEGMRADGDEVVVLGTYDEFT